MDEISGKIKEEVIIQIGDTKYVPKNAGYFHFKPDSEMQEFYRKARVVVCHGGAGTMLDAFDYQVPIIAVPRLKRYREALNDHQLEIVNALAEEKKIIAVYDINDLNNVLNDINKTKIELKRNRNLIINLKLYIKGVESK